LENFPQIPGVGKSNPERSEILVMGRPLDCFKKQLSFLNQDFEKMKTMEVFIPPAGQKTPAGGVRAEIYYFDANSKPTPKSKAMFAVIRELAKDGSVLKETYGSLEK